MTETRFPYFYAKILLFGEYSLMVGSNAFSMPLSQFGGELKFAKTESLQGPEIQSNYNLRKFVQALKKMNEQMKLPVVFDFERLFADLDNGLFFDSTIPQGYGLGSSGALVAAVFHSYALNIKNRSASFSEDEIKKLKNDFSIMESYFHGKSSGLDPLICYLSKPINVESNGNLHETVVPPSKTRGKKVLFLLDTGLTGETQPLVNYFVRQCENKHYLNKITNELIPLNNQSIHAFLQGDTEIFKEKMRAISAFTMSNFSPMIPEQIKKIWTEGLESKIFSLKLCGSGGGGMMLGYTENIELTSKLTGNFTIEPVYRF